MTAITAHSSRPAHPRSRGENITSSRWTHPGLGSSPLTRGKHADPRRRQEVRGLIPAHAGKTSPWSPFGPVSPAHPRSRGENPVDLHEREAYLGSSPLTRGKPFIVSVHSPKCRLIPAHAGKTSGPGTRARSSPAHPRSRGENPRPGTRVEIETGSSPLTRGKPTRWGDPAHPSRLIPAHAGKTDLSRYCSCARRAHPRSRGENDGEQLLVEGGGGSSPLTRGKRGGLSETRQGLRLIPAHAGKTRRLARSSSMTGAHPRSRGENQTQQEPVWEPPGSSPLTRGKQYVGKSGKIVRGLIPAHAGKTKKVPLGASGQAAHPRSRGENSKLTAEDRQAAGSSPLTRGKLDDREGVERCERLIPAHAGKTAQVVWLKVLGRAHPRSRGENCVPCQRAVVAGGSSPLTRGKRRLRGLPARTGGLIPAHAGKTNGQAKHVAANPAHPRSRGENFIRDSFLRDNSGSSPLTRGKRCAG